MRKLILLSFILFSTCAFYVGQEDWDYTTPCDYEPLSLSNIEWYCNNEISYLSDQEQYGTGDYFATPEQTLKSMKGDCEDRAAVFGMLAYTKLGVDVIFEKVNRSDGHGHMQVRADGEIWMAEYFDSSDSKGWKIIKTYNYGQMMWICENTHGSYPGSRKID